MCDTMVALGNSTEDGSVLFAKNSDRQPNEPHIMIRVPGMQHDLDNDPYLQVTYIKIPQVRETYEVVLLKPSWIWGCEMGWNEHGLNIGNEAVFTKEKNGKPALIGMDMVRLALERCKTSTEAVELMTGLLAAHGQGGNCGYEKPFTYHNSFLIAKGIQKYCPGAWVINYTNPMTICVRTLYEVFPQIKAFGCCHEVFGTQELFIKMLQDMEGIEGAHREDIRVNVLGINHFTWIDKASYKGYDLMALYKRFVEKCYKTGFDDGEKDHWMNSFFASANRVKFDLFKRYGLAAAAGDRHLAEFLPPWYLKDPETVRTWKYGLTPVNWRMEQLKTLREKSKRLVSGEEELELKKSGEEGIRQIKALLGLGDFITNVNIPNRGQLEGIPLGAIVETNAVFSRDSVRPVFAGKLPDDIQSLVMRQVLNQETIMRAALNRDKEMAFRAFINDPLVTIDIASARELFDEMLKNTKKYLPGWDIQA